ncbi:hypothetical protein ACIPYQ_39950 [Streptomyces sp. NPDC090045]|uniref:hypothetical protein n=1 Tax=Streptomyces sp. NPDC090045 TaxID=3365927 RepID=UPI0038059C56
MTLWHGNQVELRDRYRARVPLESPTNDAAPTAATVSFTAAAAALEAINQSVKDARPSPERTPKTTAPLAAGSGPHPALAALLMLGEVREELAGWESGLIETARGEGASWADLAGPLGVASGQAAERRYLRLRLRLRPGTPGSTGEERIQATRAADRTVTAWARDNAADLRRLVGQITSLANLPASAQDAVSDLAAERRAYPNWAVPRSCSTAGPSSTRASPPPPWPGPPPRRESASTRATGHWTPSSTPASSRNCRSPGACCWRGWGW